MIPVIAVVFKIINVIGAFLVLRDLKILATRYYRRRNRRRNTVRRVDET